MGQEQTQINQAALSDKDYTVDNLAREGGSNDNDGDDVRDLKKFKR